MSESYHCRTKIPKLIKDVTESKWYGEGTEENISDGDVKQENIPCIP